MYVVIQGHLENSQHQCPISPCSSLVDSHWIECYWSNTRLAGCFLTTIHQCTIAWSTNSSHTWSTLDRSSPSATRPHPYSDSRVAGWLSYFSRQFVSAWLLQAGLTVASAPFFGSSLAVLSSALLSLAPRAPIDGGLKHHSFYSLRSRPICLVFRLSEDLSFSLPTSLPVCRMASSTDNRR